MPKRLAASAAILLIAALTVSPTALPQIDPNTIVDPPDPVIERHRIEVLRARESAPVARTVEVGGETISLHFHFTNRPPWLGPEDGRSGGFFEPLAAAARAGDDAAAHRLYEELQKCRFAVKTGAELDARIAKARAWFEQTGGVYAETGEKVEKADLEEGLAHLARDFRRCEGVTPEMSVTAVELLRESVERGYDDNRMLYAYAIFRTDPKEARAQADLVWQRGYLEGLRMLGELGSLPHAIAAVAADNAWGAAGAQDREWLARLEAETSPTDLQKATKEAVQILRNPACCKR